MKRILLLLAAVLITSGCSGGPVLPGPNLDIGTIDGPDRILNYAPTSFSVVATGNADIVYSWTVDPQSAGTFSEPGSPSTLFQPADIPSGTLITITVTVSTKNVTPVTRSISTTAYGGWIAVFGGTETELACDLAVDTSGNIYTTGKSGADADFDPGTGVFNHDGGEVFLNKIGTYGDHEWALTWDASSATGVAVNDNDVGVCGSYTDGPDLDPGPGVFIESSEYNNSYVTVFDQDGDLRWCSPTLGYSYYDYINFQDTWQDGDFWNVDIETGPGGNWNYLMQEMWWWETGENDKYHTPGGTDDGNNRNVLSYNSLGEYQWSTLRTSEYQGNRLAIDASSNTYTAGESNGLLYIAKLDSAGFPLWKLSVTNGYFEDVTMDSTDCPIAVGYSSDSGSEESVVYRYDASGNLLTSLEWGSDSEDRATGVDVAPDGSVYVTGWFAGSTDFDPGPADSTVNLTGDHGYFLSKFSSTLEFQWVRTWGDTFDDHAFEPFVEVDVYGGITIVGTFSGSADLDPGPNADIRTSAGLEDIYVIKLNPDGLIE